MSVHFSNLYGIFKNSSYHVSKEKTSAQRQKRTKPLLGRPIFTRLRNGGFDFQSRRFFAFTQTYDEFSGNIVLIVSHLLMIQSIINWKIKKHSNQFTMSVLFCVMLFYIIFLPLYFPLSEFINTGGTI